MKYLFTFLFTISVYASQNFPPSLLAELDKVESERSRVMESIDKLIHTLDQSPEEGRPTENTEILETYAIATIAKEVSRVQIAKANAIAKISKAIDKIETADSSLRKQIESKAMKDIAEAITSVETIKAKAVKNIVDTTRQVELVKHKGAIVTLAHPKEALTIAKNTSAVQIAQSVSHAEINRLVATIEIARSSVRLSPLKAGSKEKKRFKKIQAEATANISSYLAYIEVIKANMLAKIAKEVAKVEVAKVEAGIQDTPTVSTYPKKLIRAD